MIDIDKVDVFLVDLEAGKRLEATGAHKQQAVTPSRSSFREALARSTRTFFCP